MPDDRFHQERLQVAREFRGLTQATLAREVAASPTLISLIESGDRNPAPELVAAFGEVLGFRTPFFFEPLPDRFGETECSFRHRRSTPKHLKAQIRAHGTLLGLVIGALKTQLRFPNLNLPRYTATTASEIERAAEQSRLYWNLGLDAPILEVTRVLEHAGVIVMYAPKAKKVDAFSRHGETSVIFLNQSVPSTSRWAYDIAHECGHLTMHVGQETGTKETEAAADRYAGAFLMPRRGFERDFRSFSWPHIFDLKKRWRVSLGAIVRRAYDLSLITAVEYRRAYQYMSMKGWTRGEPNEPSFQDPELLQGAFKALGTAVRMTIQDLCDKVHFTPTTFQDVTGETIPPPKRATLIRFPTTHNIPDECQFDDGEA
jgi:Zn-dependent peptidase ImmA (M78 family)/DNA-binding XRE family transcriptional regulator